ncbi:MAG: hypothetical protein JXQ96_03925 [Cyclobacteriaceae bacterium]
MEGTDRPQWYAITYVIFIILFVYLLSLINSGINHRRPNKKYVDRAYSYSNPEKKELAVETKKKKSEPKEKETIPTELESKEEKAPDTEPVKEEEFVSISEDLSDAEYFKKLIKNYQSTTLANLERPESRKDVVLRYYTKTKDEEKVYNLRKYGFYIHERPSDSIYENYSTNTLYFGDDVSNSDIQLVAYLLAKNGIQLKKIAPSKLHDDWKSNALELGTDTLVNDLKPLLLSDFRKNWH